MRESLTKTFRHVITYGAGRVLEKGVSFALIPIYTHYFSRQDYGVSEIVLLLANLASMVLALGLSNALVRFFNDTTEKSEQDRVVSTATLACVIIGSLAGAAAYLNAGRLASSLLEADGYVFVVQLAALNFFFTFCCEMGWSYLRTRQKSGLYVALTQVLVLVSVGLNLYFVIVQRMGLAGAFLGSTIAAALLSLILLSYTFGQVGLHFSPALLRKMVAFGAPLTFSWIAAFLLNYSDRFFLQRYTDLSNVGLYAVAHKFGYIVAIAIVQPFNLNWQAQAYEIYRQADHREVFHRLFSYYSFMLTLGALALSLFAREIFDIIVDADFRSGAVYVPFIAYAYVPQGLYVFFEIGLLIHKRTKLLGLISVCTTLFNVGINAALIYFFGIWGACASAIVSFVLIAAVTYRFSNPLMDFDCDFRNVSKVIALSVVLALLVHQIPGGLGLRITAKLAAIALFVMLSFKSGLFSPREIAELRSLWEKVSQRLRSSKAAIV